MTEHRCTHGVYDGDEMIQCMEQAGHIGWHFAYFYPRSRVVYSWPDEDSETQFEIRKETEK